MRCDDASGLWVVSSAAGEVLSTHSFEDMRMSVSWKAQCFMDEEERQKYRDHSDDLTKEKVFEVPSPQQTSTI